MSSLFLQRYAQNAKLEKTQLDEAGPKLAPLDHLRRKDRVSFDPKHYHAANKDHYQQTSTVFRSRRDAEDHVKEHGGYVHTIGGEHHVVKHPVQKRSEMSSSSSSLNEMNLRKFTKTVEKDSLKKYEKTARLLDEGDVVKFPLRKLKGPHVNHYDAGLKAQQQNNNHYDALSAQKDAQIHAGVQHFKDLESRIQELERNRHKGRSKKTTDPKLHTPPNNDGLKDDVDLDQYIDSLIAEGFSEEEINVFLESIDLNETTLRQFTKAVEEDSLKKYEKADKKDKGRYSSRYRDVAYGNREITKGKARTLGFKTEEFTEAELNHLLAVESSDYPENKGSGRWEHIKENVNLDHSVPGKVERVSSTEYKIMHNGKHITTARWSPKNPKSPHSHERESGWRFDGQKPSGSIMHKFHSPHEIHRVVTNTK